MNLLAHLSMADLAGLVGVGLILLAYAGAQLDRMHPQRPPALLCNLIGALLILWSLLADFNLSAFLMESAWALVALFGLVKWALARRG